MSPRSTDLCGRVAFVTGAARGMGAAHAEALAARGADLIITDLDKAELNSVAKGLRETYGRRVSTLRLDVTAPDAGAQVSALARDTFGRLDIVVHNAGIMHDWKGVDETPAEHIQPYLDVNVLGPYAITRALRPLLAAGDQPRVIFISSQWGQVPDGHSYGYMIAKAGQLGMMKALSKELLADKILVNAVAPGAIHTRMVPDEVYDEELAAVPLGRLGEADEIAATVAFLASESAAFISGQTIAVNGGALVPGV